MEKLIKTRCMSADHYLHIPGFFLFGKSVAMCVLPPRLLKTIHVK